MDCLCITILGLDWKYLLVLNGKGSIFLPSVTLQILGQAYSADIWDLFSVRLEIVE